MFKLAWPWLLGAAPLPLLAWWLLPRARDPAQAALRIPFFDSLPSSATLAYGRPPARLRAVLAILAWIALLFAGARPQWVGEPLALPVTGRDLMLAVDISGSMQTKDLELDGRPVSRLAVVKKIAGDFIARRVGDRLGLILFGTHAYLQTPLTFDRATLRTLLDESVIGMAGKQTAIGDAIGLAIKRLTKRPGSNRVLVLLTDGANTAGEVSPVQAARLVARKGLTIYTIGIGASEMIVRGFFTDQRVNPSADLDEASLKQIAATTGGRYFRARDSEQLRKIYRILDRLQPAAKADQIYRPISELYPWPLAVALLIGIALVFAAAPPRWLRGVRGARLGSGNA